MNNIWERCCDLPMS